MLLITVSEFDFQNVHYIPWCDRFEFHVMVGEINVNTQAGDLFSGNGYEHNFLIFFHSVTPSVVGSCCMRYSHIFVHIR